jgi:TolB-like protein/DNA-binding winged helix-turn-helix (wHTH) protein/Flp pilus assembly protein TadD
MAEVPGSKYRFGVFEADIRSGELRKHGVRIKLQDQPFGVLVMLLERAGEVVTREELRKKLWPEDVFVDFDQGLNKAVNKLREALGDTADNPRFVETIPRRGYRFIAPVHRPSPDETTISAIRPLADAPSVAAAPPAWRRPVAILAVVAGLAVGAALLYRRPLEIGPAPRSEQRTRLAVLPFENLSGDPEQEYFSDGMTEEIITQLGRLQPERLGVIPRATAMRYKASRKSVEEIGRELSVDYILSGSVRREGARTRVSAQLVHIGDGTELWAENYDRDSAGVITVQHDVALGIARSLTLQLLPERRAALAHPPTTSGDAHEAYLRGRFYWNERTEDSLRKSLQYFELAIQRDPAYALGYAGLADSYNLMADFGGLSPEEALPRAKAAAQRALQLDDTLAEAHASLGWVSMVYDWDWASAERQFQRAIELDPGYASAHQWYAYLLRVSGRGDEALAEARRAQQLDPSSLIISSILGWHHYLAREYDQALVQFQRARQLDPNFARVHSYLGWTYLQQGKFDQAIAELEEAHRLAGTGPARLAELGHAYAVAGRKEQAQKVLRQLHAAAPNRYLEPDLIALIYAGLGERDEAFRWLEKAYAGRSVKLVILKVDPRFDTLRSDPRFADLTRRVGLP